MKAKKSFRRQKCRFVSRKEQRKQERRNKKANKHEFYLKRHCVNNQIIEQAEKVVERNIVSDKEEKKDCQSKKVEKKPKKAEKNIEEMRKEQLKRENEREERNIRSLEKKMKINRHKKKKIPRSFVDDGLSYILEACDSETLKEFEPEKEFMELDHFGKDSHAENLNISDAEDDDDKHEDDSDGEHEDDSDGEHEDDSDGEHEDDSDGEHEDDSDGKHEDDSDGEHEGDSERRAKKRTYEIEFEYEADEQPQVPLVQEKRRKEMKRVTWRDELESYEEMEISQAEENESEREPNDGEDKDDNDNEDDIDNDIGSDNEIEADEDECKKNAELWEDIYGRQRDKAGNVVEINKYILPSKRMPINSDSEKLQKLKKQLKGLVNRLSEANMKGITSQVEDLYHNHSRNDMNETLAQCMFSAIVQTTLTPERLIQEHAMMVALLHANVGSEIGAHFLQMLAVKFNDMHSKNLGESKEIHNVLLFMAILYNFKVVHSLLIINVLQQLTDAFRTLDVELILLLFKNIGFCLRKDDPVMLKELIIKIQAKAQQVPKEGEIESRVRFMLEILMAIKNNNMNKIPNYDPSHMEHLKKLLRGMIRNGCYITELRISLNDLLNAETKGRWWIVGSSWSGELRDGETKAERKTVRNTETFNETVLELAKKQRMNTDIRRNIFCIIMTAEDCVDSFEKLMKLGLQNPQNREIVHVIIHCCMNEATFNPYYSYLSSRFCADRKYQLAFQCTLWDHFKNLSNLKKSQLSNLALFVANVINLQKIPLSVLKVIQFAEMDNTLIKFLRKLFIHILLNENEEHFKEVFLKITANPKLRMLREGVRLFLLHFILSKKETLDFPKQVEERIKHAEKILLMADKVVLL